VEYLARISQPAFSCSLPNSLIFTNGLSAHNTAQSQSISQLRIKSLVQKDKYEHANSVSEQNHAVCQREVKSGARLEFHWRGFGFPPEGVHGLFVYLLASTGGLARLHHWIYIHSPS